MYVLYDMNILKHNQLGRKVVLILEKIKQQKMLG